MHSHWQVSFLCIHGCAATFPQIGLSACILVGPLLYLHIKYLISKKKSLSKGDWAHIIVPFSLIVTIGFLRPYVLFPDFWNIYAVRIIYAVWLLYCIATIPQVWPMMRKSKPGKSSVQDQWMVLVFCTVFTLCIIYIMAYYGFPYISGPILFSLVFYIFIGFLLFKKRYTQILFEAPQKYGQHRVSKKEDVALIQQITGLMEKEKQYLNPKIKMATFADSIQAKPHMVSRVINDQLGVSFNHFINQYRIEDACQLLKTADHLTIEGIGSEVGFNSRSAFYNAFKSIMNQTPVQFKATEKKKQLTN